MTTAAEAAQHSEIMVQVNSLLDADSDYVWTMAKQYKDRGHTTSESFRIALAMLGFQRARNFAPIAQHVEDALDSLSQATGLLGGVNCTEQDRLALEKAFAAVASLHTRTVAAVEVESMGRPDDDGEARG